MRKCWRAAILLGLPFLVFAPSLPFPFVWDDVSLVVHNREISSPRNLPHLFAQDLYPQSESNNYYRPLQALSNALNLQIWGKKPWAFRLTNVLVHALTGVLLFRLFALWTGSAVVSFAAALLWGVHPLHAESVTYIAGLADPLSAFFLLLMLLCRSRARSAPRRNLAWNVGACVAFLASLASKEIAFVGIPLIVLQEWKEGGRLSLRSLGRTLAPYVVMTGIFAVARGLVLGVPLGTALQGAGVASGRGHPLGLLAYPLEAFAALRLIFFPYPLHMERLAPGLGSMGWIHATAATLLLVGTTAFLFRPRLRASILTLAFAFFLVALSPLLILNRMGFLFLDHFLYLPAFGVALAFTSLLRFPRAWIFVVAILALLVPATYVQNQVWRSPIALYEHILRFSAGSTRARYNLALAYHAAGRSEEAERELHKVLSLGSDPEAEATLADLEEERGDDQKALERLDRALAEKPNRADWRNQRALLLRKLGRRKEALQELEAAVHLDPKLYQAWFNLGLVRNEMGRNMEAAQAFETAAKIEMTGAVAVELAKLKGKNEGPGAAIRFLEGTLTETSDSPELYNQLGLFYAKSGKLADAERIWKRGLDRFPSDPFLQKNLSILRGTTAK